MREPHPNWQELVVGHTEGRGNGIGRRMINFERMKLGDRFYMGEQGGVGVGGGG